jgi:hypothetical protein
VRSADEHIQHKRSAASTRRRARTAAVGVAHHIDEGSLRFFVNGVPHGPGYPAGSVTGPVVCAVQLEALNASVRLLPHDVDHALLQQE